VLTQHRTDPRLGPAMLAHLRKRAPPESVMHELERDDPHLGWRQLAAIDAQGRAAFFNGRRITSIAKGRVGRDCVAIGNILRTTEVVDAMVGSFEAAEAQPLAERLVRAAEAGLAAGGELKHLRSAALLVVHRESFPYVDLRIDLSPEPLRELRFLWELYREEADAFVQRAVDPDGATPAA
jgi:uncharacterized Ntn-hydrolase superfamily protein